MSITRSRGLEAPHSSRETIHCVGKEQLHLIQLRRTEQQQLPVNSVYIHSQSLLALPASSKPFAPYRPSSIEPHSPRQL